MRFVAMKFRELGELGAGNFRRLTGIKRATFEHMVEILRVAEREKNRAGGKPNRLSLEERLLMTLAYWREYRTYFHISQDVGVAESTAYRNIRWVENTLVKHPDFALPGRKALRQSEATYEVVLVDATETPIERPLKNSEAFTRGRKNATR